MWQKPKMQSTRLPGIIAFRELSPFMFCPMISAPASPKPSARSEPILIMVFSNTAVSIGSSVWSAGRNFLVQRFSLACISSTRPWSLLPRISLLSKDSSDSPLDKLLAPKLPSGWALFLLSSAQTFSCSRCRALSPIAKAASGFLLILFTPAIMRSMGWSTRLFASLEKTRAPSPRIRQMKMVCKKFSRASMFDPLRRSNTKIQNSCFASSSDTHLGETGRTTERSW
mmetsp:Transcript_38950/g.102944  ORF Transcript_38950/g.102944 Transcript_38950/m.102944 type:complete len:227 (+) Transcript_38950:1118-1798(+)